MRKVLIKFYFLLFCFFFIFVSLFGINTQYQKKIDSLLNVIKITNHDTTRVKALFTLCSVLRHHNPDKGLFYAKQGLDLALKIKYKFGIAYSLFNLGCIQRDKSKYSSGIEYLQTSLKLFEEIDNQRGILNCYNEIGQIYETKGDYENATKYFNSSLKIAEKLNDISYQARCYSVLGVINSDMNNQSAMVYYYFKALNAYEKINNYTGMSSTYRNIGYVYELQGNLNKALEYTNKALKIAHQLDNKSLIAYCYLGLGNIYLDRTDYDKSLIYLLNALHYSEILGDQRLMAICYGDIGKSYLNKGLFPLAKGYFSDALNIFEKLNTKQYLSEIYLSLSTLNLNLKNYKEALSYADKCIILAKETNSLKELFNIYGEKSVIYDSLGNKNKALEYYKLYYSFHDSLFNSEKQKNLAEVDAKYQNEKKQKEIISLTKNLQIKQFRLNQLYFLSAIILLLTIFVSFFISVIRKKRASKLLWSKVIEAEENEKKHFAAELHDGLNPVLSIIKMYCSVMRNTNVNNKQIELLTNIEESLNEALETSISISNKITPLAIERSGLYEAVRNYCNKMNALNHLKFIFNVTGDELRFSTTIETVLFRVLSELINNTINHAEAKNIEINFTINEKSIEILYKDDGKGFDVNKLNNKSNKGLGMNNIMNRIKSINGTYSFKSKIGNGFNASIMVKV